MTWQLLVLISVLSASVATVLQRVLLRENDNATMTYAITFQILTGLLIAVYAVIRGFDLQLSTLPLPNLIAMIALYTIGTTLLFKALNLIEASEFSILFTARTLWSVVAAYILLQETFSIIQIWGVVLVVTATIIATWSKTRIRFGKGEILASLAALTFGVAFVNDAFILSGGADVPSYLTLGFLGPGVILVILNPSAAANIRKFVKGPKFKIMFLLSTLYAISAITVFLAFQIGNNAAQIASLNQVQTVLVVIIGIFLLGERKGLLKKIIAGILSFVGVVMLLL